MDSSRSPHGFFADTVGFAPSFYIICMVVKVMEIMDLIAARRCLPQPDSYEFFGG